MKKHVILLFLTAVQLNALACEVCGCASMSATIGYMPSQIRNRIGLNYQLSRYQSNHPGTTDYFSDRFASYSLSGRMRIARRIFVSGNLPFVRNQQGETQKSGIGDFQFMLHQLTVDQRDSNGLGWLWMNGLGVKTPTGHYKSEVTSVLPANLFPGTGSWDGLAHSALSFRSKFWVGFTELSYRYTTSNPLGYQSGNQFITTVQIFRVQQFSMSSVLFGLGERSSYVQVDRTNEVANMYSGGSIHALTGSVQFYATKWALRASYEKPFQHRFSKGYVTPLDQLTFNITYLI
ncbi:MAG: hypothetical protein H6608_09535 [Flavobacteriales bacterium]|nr:hypothetical protein [Bacteroidota bacterium]MCB9241363.1 hypothetical protein [Flavobacteriales bacterium]